MRKVALVLSLACALSLSAQQSPAWKILDKGNKDFRGESISFPDLVYARSKLSNGQNPPVTVLSCSDSRVPPELVFNRSLGQIFLVRSAGNVTDQLGIASIEYAIKKKWTKLLVILAHEKCGAVEEAMRANGDPTGPPDPDDGGDNRNLIALVTKIKESFGKSKCPDAAGCWAFRAEQNAVHTVEVLKSASPRIKKAIEVDKLPVVIAYYELKSGKVVVWKTINN
jgi:carbonic anhydrase